MIVLINITIIILVQLEYHLCHIIPFLKLGFLDGKEGFYLARFKAHYFFQIQTKVAFLKLKK